MSLVAGGVGAVIALLLSGGFTKIEQLAQANGDTILRATSKDGLVTNVQLKNNAVISPQFDLVRISTDRVSFRNSNQPDYFTKNESSVIKRIFALSIIPDSAFQTKGILKITLNDAPLFPITPLVAGNFTDISALNIPIPDTYGLKILPKDELKVFIASPDGTSVTVSVAIFIGELP